MYSNRRRAEVLALGRVGWTLSRIAAATGVHRVTAGGYLRAAGIPVRGRGRPRENSAKPTITAPVSTDARPANPTISAGVSTDSAAVAPTRAPSASACEAYREVIAEAVGRGRNAMAIWQDLVDDHGFAARYASVRRYVATLRDDGAPEARVIITTAPGEDYGESAVMLSPEKGDAVTGVLPDAVVHNS